MYFKSLRSNRVESVSSLYISNFEESSFEEKCGLLLSPPSSELDVSVSVEFSVSVSDVELSEWSDSHGFGRFLPFLAEDLSELGLFDWPFWSPLPGGRGGWPEDFPFPLSLFLRLASSSCCLRILAASSGFWASHVANGSIGLL